MPKAHFSRLMQIAPLSTARRSSDALARICFSNALGDRVPPLRHMRRRWIGRSEHDVKTCRRPILLNAIQGCEPYKEVAVATDRPWASAYSDLNRSCVARSRRKRRSGDLEEMANASDVHSLD